MTFERRQSECPLCHNESGMMIQDMEDASGITESYKCRKCDIYWPTGYAIKLNAAGCRRRSK